MEKLNQDKGDMCWFGSPPSLLGLFIFLRGSKESVLFLYLFWSSIKSSHTKLDALRLSHGLWTQSPHIPHSHIPFPVFSCSRIPHSRGNLSVLCVSNLLLCACLCSSETAHAFMLDLLTTPQWKWPHPCWVVSAKDVFNSWWMSVPQGFARLH